MFKSIYNAIVGPGKKTKRVVDGVSWRNDVIKAGSKNFRTVDNTKMMNHHPFRSNNSITLTDYRTRAGSKDRINSNFNFEKNDSSLLPEDIECDKSIQKKTRKSKAKRSSKSKSRSRSKARSKSKARTRSKTRSRSKSARRSKRQKKASSRSKSKARKTRGS